MLDSIAFYVFALPLLASAAAMVGVRNPVYAVLFMVLAFANGAGIFLTVGAEFLAFILLIVSIGAIAVLFLFVVMMLGLRAQGFARPARGEKIAGLTVCGLLLAQLLFAVFTGPSAFAPAAAPTVENTRALGRVLYTDYVFPFQMAGLILLVAIIGAIVLALYPRRGGLRQSPLAQTLRDPKKVVQLCNIKPGEGASR